MMSCFKVVSLCMVWTSLAASVQGDELQLQLRFQQETSPDSGRYHTLTRNETWQPTETAIIICDVWDSHNCWNAVQRVNEMAPRLDRVVQNARAQGVTIIHAPSGCMDHYESHPARLRAVNTPKSSKLPEAITQWCYQIPAEERGKYPIDQEDGGCDDTPEQHANWEKQLVAEGRREHKWPWRKETEAIEIDRERDYVSDRGDEIWSILETRGIHNVILTGVHTNMCVLGRPFGLRQMSKNGKNVVLMRDLTDTMYNPARAPFVSHFSGTDLIIGHIERFVCPTITSNQILGDEPFRFKHDQRPHLVIVMAEDEYKTETSLPQYAIDHLWKDYRVTLVFGDDTDRNDIPGLEAVDTADLLLVSIRRRVLPEEQMAHFRKHVAAGKPVVGIRTASHAFSLRNAEPPQGYVDWTAFDPDVFGGSYHGHHGNKLVTTVQIQNREHPILSGIETKEFQSRGSLYEVSPLAKGTTVLATGTVENAAPEPVAWTYQRKDGGRTFYTSLGHTSDFEQVPFQQLLLNGIHWALSQ